MRDKIHRLVRALLLFFHRERVLPLISVNTKIKIIIFINVMMNCKNNHTQMIAVSVFIKDKLTTLPIYFLYRVSKYQISIPKISIIDYNNYNIDYSRLINQLHINIV